MRTVHRVDALASPSFLAGVGLHRADGIVLVISLPVYVVSGAPVNAP
jgi:hypothetical protein